MSNYSSLYSVQVANNEFAASSPDEKAILECCADHGFVFQVGNFTQLPNCKIVSFLGSNLSLEHKGFIIDLVD